MELVVSSEIEAAQKAQRPVVALETTVLTHGMSWPHNVETLLAMEQAIREEGATPATLGIVNGEVTVGLSVEQIESFGKAPADSISKCSRRDLPSVVAARRHGALTVAGTIVVADAANIRIFATGGIGGVHRGHPEDVSADLYELGRTPVAVVCAGAKSILDLPLTMEVLESQGVPLIGLGTPNLPAFFARDSGLPLPHSVSTTEEAADLLRAWNDLEAGNGMLVTVPVPEEHAIDAGEAEAAIARAVAEADAAGVTGSRLTPFILARVVELTEGRSLEANKALLRNNARIASILARQAQLGRTNRAF
jgi:pseudouridine-5'-phosphate glycosidase